MKDYANFRTSDFANDEYFIQWIKRPNSDPDLDNFWENWIQANPQKKDQIDRARLIVLSLVTEEEYVPEPENVRKTWRRIEQSIGAKSSRSLRLLNQTLRYAAVFLLIAIALVFYFRKATPITPKQFVASDASESNDDFSKTFSLPDGTVVEVMAQSDIEVLSNFGDSTREVRLVGEAFFKVAKDPTRPFIVYSDEIVTRVLGTSFVIRNYDQENEITVKVKTGRVSVFKRDEIEPKSGLEKSAVVLTPNQQAVYDSDKAILTKTLVDNPDVVSSVTAEEFNFVDASVKDVFLLIENTYAVDILFDEELLDKCHINASLADLSLYKKIDIICKAINATYEVIDTHIVVYSAGCALDEDRKLNR